MKKVTFIFIIEIIFSIAFIIDSYAEVRCQPYARSNNYAHCYDLKTIQYSGKRFVKVLIKATAVTDNGRETKINTMNKRGLSTAGYENYLYTYELVEIDCKERKIRNSGSNFLFPLETFICNLF